MDLTQGPYGRRFDWLNAAWRYSRALYLFRRQLPFNRRRDDMWIAMAVKHLQGGEGRGRAGALQLQAIAQAVELANSDLLTRFTVEGRILARLDNQTIAERSNLPVAVIEAFEMLFCDVRDQLEGGGWIRSCVIHTEGMPHGAPTLRGSLLNSAYMGGEQVTEDVIESLLNRGAKYLGNWKDINRLDNGLNELDRLILYTLQSLTTPLTTANVLQLMKQAAAMFAAQVGDNAKPKDEPVVQDVEPWEHIARQAYACGATPAAGTSRVEVA